MIDDFCIPLVGCPSSIGGSIASDAAGAVMGQIATEVGQAAQWLVNQAVDFAVGSTSPAFDAQGFSTELDLMRGVALLVVLPILCLATIGPMLRQDGRGLVRVWGIGLPVAVFSGFAVAQITQLALSATDQMCSAFISGTSGTIASSLDAIVSSDALGAMPTAVQILLAGIVCLGAVMVWLELVVRAAGVYVAVFFMPMALVAFIWPATAHIAKRAVEMLVALVMSKFVIVAALSLGLTTVAESGSAAVLSGCGILLIAAFAPFLLFRMTPVIEAAAIAHLEGLSRTPVNMARSAAATGASVAGNPAVAMMMNSASKSGSGPAGVGPVDSALNRVPDAVADYHPRPADE